MRDDKTHRMTHAGLVVKLISGAETHRATLRAYIDQANLYTLPGNETITPCISKVRITMANLLC